MGEIIYSCFIGGLLAFSGVVLLVVLHREEKKLQNEREEKK